MAVDVERIWVSFCVSTVVSRGTMHETIQSRLVTFTQILSEDDHIKHLFQPTVISFLSQDWLLCDNKSMKDQMTNVIHLKCINTLKSM